MSECTTYILIHFEYINKKKPKNTKTNVCLLAFAHARKRMFRCDVTIKNRGTTKPALLVGSVNLHIHSINPIAL